MTDIERFRCREHDPPSGTCVTCIQYHQLLGLKYYSATRSSSLYTFLSMWLFAEARTAEEANVAQHWVYYGRTTWPSYSEWMVPKL